MRTTTRYRAVAAGAALALVVVTASVAGAEPTEEDVRAAHAAADDAASRVADIEVRLAGHAAERDSAWTAVGAAAEDYAAAKEKAEQARQDADDAAAASERAAADRETARAELGVIAMQAYRSGGSMDTLGAMLSADGFEDLAHRTQALDRLGVRADRVVQRFTAADLAAGTMAELAATASAEAERAAAGASAALAAAEQAQTDAERRVAEVERLRDDLIAELAALRGTAEATERARQDARDRQRREREESSSADERGVDREGSSSDSRDRRDGSSSGSGGRGGSDAGNGSGSSGSGSSGSGSSGSGSNGSGSNGSGSNGSGTGGRDQSGSSNGGSSSGGSSSGGSSGSGSGGDRGSGGGGGTSTPTPTPTPTPTSTPTSSDPHGLGTGSQRGSAAQGRAAVAWAVDKVGTPYGWGATGPDAYDCSGLTSRAWAAAGVPVNRTSRDQYRQVRKIRYADMRPGDLIFYGSNQRDPGSITHVAMFIGGGQMVEASRPGVPVRVTGVRWSGTMPFAGRP